MGLLSKKRIAGLFVTAALAAGVYFFTASGPAKEKSPPPPAEPRPVKYMTIARRESGGERIFPGKIVASQKVNLSFRVSGQVIELPSVKGVFVEKGTLLARLDPRDLGAACERTKRSRQREGPAISHEGRGTERGRHAFREDGISKSPDDRCHDHHGKGGKKLYKAGGFSRAEYDKARTSYQVACSAYQSATQELAKLLSGPGPRTYPPWNSPSRGSKDG